jgi:ankyrin repeat protein
VQDWLCQRREFGNSLTQIEPYDQETADLYSKIAVIESEQMAALLEVTERIVRVISRGQVYESVYLRNEKAAVDNKLSKGLENSLTKIYYSVLDLSASSADLFKNNTVVRAFKSLYNQGSIASGLAGIDAQEESMLKDVQALEVRRSANADNSMIEMLEKLDAPIVRMDVGIQHLLQSIDEAERMDMLEWISSVPFGRNHQNIKGQRTPDTGQWLMQDEKFQAWEKESSSGLFWIQGLPGMGKTFLTSTVVDFVQEPLATEPKDEGFAFFYCDKNEASRSKPLSILQSMVRQLSTTPKSPDATRTELHTLYKQCRKHGSVLDLEQCKEQILASLDIYEKSTIVLDALDECDADTRDELLDVFNQFLLESKRPVKVFISSRPSTDIEAQLERGPDASIEASNNEGDILKFLSMELDKLGKKANVFSTLKEDIIKVLLARCHGMFQWASLQTHQISKCRTPAAVRSRLANLPEDLEKAYDEAWSQIQEFEEGDKVFVTRAMLWVMAAEKPFSSRELLSAIRVNNSSEQSFFADEVNPEDLLYLCNNLLTVDTQLHVWRFAHLSVAEYLQSKMGWHLAQTHFHAASTSLRVFGALYDNEHADHVEAAELLHNDHPFYVYLRHHWFRHCQKAQYGEATNLQPLLQTFLGSPNESSKLYQRWYEMLDEDYWNMDPAHYGAYGAAGLDDAGGDLMDLYQSDPYRYEDFESELSPADRAVFAMCHFSFSACLSDWWEGDDFNASSVNERGHSLLTIAARAGCTPICEYLVGRGVDVDSQVKGEVYGSALAAAAAHGHTETVEYLVKVGAGVNLELQNGKYSSALVAAAGRKGEVEVVKCLVANGGNVNLNVKTGPFGTVLALAAHEDKLKVVRYLLDCGANVNQPTGNADFATALHHAAAFGSPAVISSLIKAGAHVNCIKPAGKYGTPLMAAAYWGRKDNVVCLVEAGADVNLKLDANDEHRPDCLLSPLAVAQDQDSFQDGDGGLWMYLRVGAQEENRMDMLDEMEKGGQEVAEYLENHGATT